MKYRPSDKAIVHALRCISGEITPEVRLVAFQSRNDDVLFRFYMDCEPTDFHKERAEIVASNFDAGWSVQLNSLEIEFVHTNEPLGHLDHLGFGVYRRWEE